ncbi:MAG TPA: ribbon-helix-helix protein, CopG family [Campylobacterales bacterium]|nr:ribbon-helix-helix protein, CopG family [Campylobacterales bacterium]
MKKFDIKNNMMYKGFMMQRTQIYFEETMLEELKQKANSLGISLSAHIRDSLKKNLNDEEEEPKQLNFSEFSGMWKDKDITQESIRKDAWK